MKAATISKPGPPDVLEIRDVPSPEPSSGQVLARVMAFSLNRADLLQCRGHYPAPPGWPQDIPGLEFAGEVEAVGAGVEGVQQGDRVMGIVGGGAYAEYLTTPADHLVAVPEGLAFEEAAAIPEAFLTAFDALERLNVDAGQWVLVTAVGSGVGTAALQLVKARGAFCVGTSRTLAKLRGAERLGMDAGIDSSSENLVKALREIRPEGVDAAVDLVGGATVSQTIESMANRGRMMLVGLTAGRQVELDLGVVLRNRLRIEGTVLRGRSNEEKAALTKSFAERALPFFTSGTLSPVVDRVFDFDDVVDALRHLESNRNFGNVVVRIG